MIEQATVKTKQPLLWWAVPILSLGLAIALGFQFWVDRGLPIILQFQHGYGLQPGDTLRYRGINVGLVESVLLKSESDRPSIEVSLRLSAEAKHIARTGSLFWINRPQVGVEKISGLDALIGATYIQVMPGKGEPRYHFVGLESTPMNADLRTGGIEITLQTNRLAGLREGAPVRYRQISIGKVIRVGLSSDASAVEAQAYIQPKYLSLIRDNAHFWQSSGITASAGLSGFSLKVDSLTNAVLGGVEMAVPEQVGKQVHQGHRFKLHAQVEEHWLDWRPSIPLGNPLLPGKSTVPALANAVLRWKEKNYGLMESDQQRQGWLIAYQGGWLGPANMLRVPEDATDKIARLEVSGQSYPINRLQQEHSTAWISAQAPDIRMITNHQLRQVTGVEDVVILSGQQAPYKRVSASRIDVQDGRWQIDPMLSFDAQWHGAAVLSAQDGKLLGILLVSEDTAAEIALIPVTLQTDAG